jgi:hypothetical protein
MALNRKTFKKVAADAPVAANTFASENFNTVLYTGNGGTQRIGGYINRGAVFNGSSSYINIPNVNSLFLGKTTSSVSFWFRLLNNSSKVQLFSDYAVESWNYAVSIETNGTLGITSRYNNGSVVAATSTAAYDDGNWHHLCITHDVANSSQKAYVDGNTTPVATLSIPSGSWSSSYQSSAKINIGHQFLPQTSTRSEYLNGTIDQVRIFDKALSSSEVTTLYGETHSSTTISTTDIFDDNSGVALYQLDGNANDTGGVSGKFGSAAIFNGSSSRITLPTSVITQDNFSYSLWMYPTVNYTGSIVRYVFAHQASSGSRGISFGYVIDGWKAIVGNGANQKEVTMSSPTLNTWTHITVTNSTSNGLELFVNGVSQGTDTYTALDISNHSGCALGSRGFSAGDYFHGKIDDVRIYSDELTDDEVGYIYNNTTASIPTDNLEAYYKLDGDARDEQQLYDGTASNVTYAYDGTATNVTYQEATKFTPDLVWIKIRNQSSWDHLLIDSVRGFAADGDAKIISSNSTNAEFERASISSFNTNGFSLGNYGGSNDNNDTYVAWCWKAGGADVLNEEGSIDSQVSANQDAGFSIVKWNTGTGTNSTVGHGLSSAPELVLYKSLSTRDWIVYSLPTGINQYLRLNTTAQAASQSNIFATPTITTFPSKAGINVGSSEDYIAYCFHSVDGYSKVGSYTGTGAAGNSVVTGFEPAFLMFKAAIRPSGAGSWYIFDNKRTTTNPQGEYLQANESAQEADGTSVFNVDFNSNGFTINGTNNEINQSNSTYIYLAIAADPDETTPTVEDSFDVVTYTGDGTSSRQIDTDFKPDLVWIKSRSSASWANFLQDSVRGAENFLISDSTGAEATTLPNIVSSFNDDGFVIEYNGNSNTNGDTYVAWCWKAGDHDDNLPQINTEGTIDSTVSVNAEAGFSIAKFTGNSTSTSTVGHGLSQAPELIFLKHLNFADNWVVYNSSIGATKALHLDLSNAPSTNSAYWNNTDPNSTTIQFGSHLNNTYNYIAYCFHSVTGYQKIGSYTGTAPTRQTIETGFEPRFVLIKKTDSSKSWIIFDNQRYLNNQYDAYLLADESNAEANLPNLSNYTVEFLSNGFSVQDGSFVNLNGGTYIYLAIK